ncbi:MAG: hypothetical protein WKF70_10540 [Chitinophagaceae bacterium]
MLRIILCSLALVGFSCSFFKEFKKEQFSPAEGISFQILVPKGWNRVQTTPGAAGQTTRSYHYANGAHFYIARTDSAVNQNEWIDTAQHIPLPFENGRVYKGVMPGLLYWRQIQLEDYRFGYRNVPSEVEARFDSALNFSALMKGVR